MMAGRAGRSRCGAAVGRRRFGVAKDAAQLVERLEALARALWIKYAQAFDVEAL
jgi:hypothetical protein